MKYFKNENNEIYAYESDGSQDEFIQGELIEVSEQEALEIANPPISKEQLIHESEQQKQLLLNESAVAIAPLQNAADLDMASEEEEKQLKAWKKYSVLVNRIDTSLAPDIEWPERPE